MVIWRSPRRGQVHDGAQGAADQTLDLLGAARRMPLVSLAARPLVRGARQHGVLGGDPAAPWPLEPRRNALLEAGGAQDMRIAEFDKAGAFGMQGDCAF